MSTAELKRELINKITQTDDEVMLNALSDLIRSFQSQEPFIMNDEQIHAVKEAREQYKKGDYLSNEAADKDIEKWLND